jgi:hypothetical protein
MADAEKQVAEDAISLDDVKSAVKYALTAILEEEGDQSLVYDHNKSSDWIAKICEISVERCVRMKKPFKYICNAVIVRKTGAGVHVCSSAHFSPQDGCVCEVFDMNESLYCAVTMYWVSL